MFSFLKSPRPGFLPAIALLSFGCIAPLVAHVDRYLLSLEPFELASLYGTDYLILAAAGLVFAALFWCGKFVSERLLAWRWLNAVSDWIARFGFFLVACFATAYLAKAWLRSLGFAWIDAIGGEVYIIVAILLTVLARPEGWLSDWYVKLWRSAQTIALLGSASLIAVAIEAGDDAPLFQPKKLTTQQRPDVILISIDALSAARMSLYGASRRTTPHIDSFAARALVFNKAYAVSNFTTPGINSILTGLYPSQHRALQLSARPTPAAIAQSLPALLKANGYHTGFVSTNAWGGALRNGYGRYFDFQAPDRVKWADYPCQDRLSVWLERLCNTLNPFVINLFRFQKVGPRSNDRVEPSLVNQAAQQFLSKQQRPSFLWVHYFPPHDPYAAPKPWLGKFDQSNRARVSSNSSPVYGFTAGRQDDAMTQALAARYDEALAWVDASVGQLLDYIGKISPEALVIISADHGESFSQGWGGHGGWLLNKDVVNIPLIVRLPGRAQIAKRSNVLTSQIDIYPIILAALAGSNEQGIEDMIVKRRRNAPVLMMAFNDNKAHAPLTKGAIAATDGEWQYTRYLGSGLTTPLGIRRHDAFDFKTPNGDAVTVATIPARTLAVLQNATDKHMARFGRTTTK